MTVTTIDQASSEADESGSPRSLPKCPTGIHGLDTITNGGLPRGRPTLVCGSAGCGKTLMAMEFLVRGAREFGEAGVFMSFEERPEELAANVRSLGFDVDELIARKQLLIDHVHVERSEIEETGEYDLEALFIRLGYAIDSISAERVVLDTLEALFSGLSNHGILRAELRRLFRWLKDKGVTAVITCETGQSTLTRHGIEEYVSDCVILLDHRVTEQLSTRRLRVVKYRGSAHVTDEVPFLIDESGMSVLPLTSVGLGYEASTERVSSGVPRLDAMLGGQGFYRGSTVLVSGTAGTGKTTLAAHFAAAACARGERCLYIAFEESADQLVRNMRSVGLDLEPMRASGLLQIYASRPTAFGLEMHLLTLQKLINVMKPSAIVFDPISNLTGAGSVSSAERMLLRLIDFLRANQITAFLTNLTGGGQMLESTEVGISSLVDTWLLLREIESNSERNRGLYILKSRGMSHSNQVREFLLTEHGVDLLDVYVGSDGAMAGSSRLAQEVRERTAAANRSAEIDRKTREIARRRAMIEAQVVAMQAELEADEAEMQRLVDEETSSSAQAQLDRRAMAKSRKADNGGNVDNQS